MSENNVKPGNDDELLANAIPIDPSELDDDSPDDDDALEPIELEESGDTEGSTGKIRAFGEREAHEAHWQRTPNITGKGAIHVKTFVTKLRLDAIEHLDGQINHWLDTHPEYEVKFVTTTVGPLKGKLTEDALFVNVWV